MQQDNTFTQDAPPPLQYRYPELVELLDDLDGFHKFISIRLRQHGLERRYHLDDIVGECLLRWHAATLKGKPIPNIMAWMKRTAFNVVSELSRDAQKATPYDPSILMESVSTTIDDADCDDRDEQRHVVRQALNTLSSHKRELLELRFVHGLSWEEIAIRFADRGESIKVATLRKRGQRALEDLRTSFLEKLQG